MIKLTKHQLSDIQNLADNPLVDQVSFDRHSNGLMRITIISALNKDLSKLDAVLLQIFPGMEYRGAMAEYPSEDGTSNTLYSIDYNGETLINLCMKKAPAPTEAEKENIQVDCTINEGDKECE